MPKTKKASQSELSRKAILSSTMDLISKYGFSGTTIDKIAGESGLSKGSIFWHFQNKEHLFLDVIESIRHGLMEGLKPGLEEAATTRDKLTVLLDNYARLIEIDCSQCLDLTVLTIEMVETNPELANKLRDLFAALADMLTTLFEQGKHAGEISAPLDSRETAYAIVGNLQGMTVQYYLNRDRFDYPQLMAPYKELLLRGLFSR